MRRFLTIMSVALLVTFCWAGIRFEPKPWVSKHKIKQATVQTYGVTLPSGGGDVRWNDTLACFTTCESLPQGEVVVLHVFYKFFSISDSAETCYAAAWASAGTCVTTTAITTILPLPPTGSQWFDRLLIKDSCAGAGESTKIRTQKIIGISGY